MNGKRALALLLMAAFAVTLVTAQPSAANSGPELTRATLIKKAGRQMSLRLAARHTTRRSGVGVVDPYDLKSVKAERRDAKHWMVRASASRRARKLLHGLAKDLQRRGRASFGASISDGPSPVPVSFFTLKAFNQAAKP